jgi:hypothetical protein
MKSHDFFFVFHRATLILCVLLAGRLSTALADDPPNPILKEMLEKGLDTGGGVLVKLPSPTMADGLNAADQTKAIMKITNPNKTLQQLLAKGDNAAFVYQITPVVGHKTAFHIDMWYVAYGSLNVVIVISPGLDERYGYSLFELMDKAYLSIASRSVQTRHGGSILMAGYIDPRFVDDAKFPDQWQPIARNAVGLPVLGKASIYTGAGGYMKVTELKEPAGALFIEGHMVYNEPQGWFNGAPLLRSKLPIMAKDNVVTFRKKLRQAMAQQGQAAGK